MLSLADLQPGTRLEVDWPAADREDGRPYVSQLLEKPHGRRLVIAIPISAFRLVSWPPDRRPMTVRFIQPERGVWRFTARLVERLTVDQIAAWRIEAIDEPVRQQRRAWYRLPCTLDLTWQPRRQPDTSDAPILPAITRDISGGGLAVVSAGPLPDATELTITLHLDERQTIRAEARILRSSAAETPNRQRISLQFTRIAARDQDILLKYILKRQIEQRRNRPEH